MKKLISINIIEKGKTAPTVNATTDRDISRVFIPELLTEYFFPFLSLDNPQLSEVSCFYNCQYKACLSTHFDVLLRALNRHDLNAFKGAPEIHQYYSEMNRFEHYFSQTERARYESMIKDFHQNAIRHANDLAQTNDEFNQQVLNFYALVMTHSTPHAQTIQRLKEQPLLAFVTQFRPIDSQLPTHDHLPPSSPFERIYQTELMKELTSHLTTGFTLTTCCVARNQPHILEFLAKIGAVLHDPMMNGTSPIFLAKEVNPMTMLKLLVTHGVKDQPNHQRSRLLFILQQNVDIGRYTSIVKVLMQICILPT